MFVGDGSLGDAAMRDTFLALRLNRLVAGFLAGTLDELGVAK